MKVCFLLLFISFSLSQDPTRFLNFLQKNLYSPPCGATPIMPLSYFVYPSNYFAQVPPNQRIPPGGGYTNPMQVPACHNEVVQPDKLNAYEFQTEQFLTTVGLNIYDGAVWSIALTLLGNTAMVKQYETTVLDKAETCQFPDIMADKPCKGIVNQGQCKDPQNLGVCGFCYGDNADTLTSPNAWLFRMISNIYSFEGVYDVRCPELKILWTWNDYKPILGENSWSRLTGPLQTAFIRADGNVNAIPDSDLTLSLNYIPSLSKMMINTIGAIHYAPYNTWSMDGLAGNEISTENQASTLAGLRMLEYILTKKGTHQDVVAEIQQLTSSIENYLRTAYDPKLGYFRQGGLWNQTLNSFTWATIFAVDCQTWVMSILGPNKVDSWFGAGTALKIWQKTKEIGGYGFDPSTNYTKGVGYSSNQQDQVFSGEWTFGAITMTRVFANELTDPTVKNRMIYEGRFMRAAIENELTTSHVINGQNSLGVLYSNKRYYIPFGWWANPLLASSSTGWAVLVDKSYNPFYLGGQYTVYDS
eukprot:TRINITY_DN6630_c0_g1_i2.p1 TRINITY_DN6630_c0_g1~~TRINITY_DN6630_c0_g1_i2.p1  ORF type:complete len:529 (-),score=60.96 TRINITY_DN6630_c0_g1_i2:32-1618(-)